MQGVGGKHRLGLSVPLRRTEGEQKENIHGKEKALPSKQVYRGTVLI